MNKEEFESYLKSIGGLESEWEPENGPILTADFFSLSEGWYGLIKDLIDELITVGWNKKVTQVKEKFGGLRFYIPSGHVVDDKWVEIKVPEAYNAIISKYEKLSYSVCEKCGKNGVVRSGPWIRTLCDEHSEGKEPLNNNARRFFG